MKCAIPGVGVAAVIAVAAGLPFLAGCTFLGASQGGSAPPTDGIGPIVGDG